MLTYNGQFEQEIRKLADAEIARRLEGLVNNAHTTPAQQHAFNSGIIVGLRMVSDLCDEAQTIMSER